MQHIFFVDGENVSKRKYVPKTELKSFSAVSSDRVCLKNTLQIPFMTSKLEYNSVSVIHNWFLGIQNIIFLIIQVFCV